MKVFTALVGSRAYGTNTEFSDRDEISAYVNPIKFYIGAFPEKDNSRVLHNETNDISNYEIRYFINMCTSFNPNVIIGLYSNETQVDLNWSWLITHRHLFNSRKAINTFCGFAYQELLRADKSDNRHFSSKRTSLIEKYGFDTKSAQNSIRLSRMLLEYLNDKEHVLHVYHDDYKHLLDIRNGNVTLNECKREFESIRLQVTDWMSNPTTELNAEPNYEEINNLFMQSMRKYL